MNCEATRKIINETPVRELHDLEPDARAHIGACDACVAAYRLRMVASESLAAAAPEIRADDAFKRRLLGALDREDGARSPAPRPRRTFSWRSLWRPGPAWAAAALVLVAVSGYNYMRTLGYFAPAGQVPADMLRFVQDVGHDAYLYSPKRQTFELETNDPDRVRAWFASRLDFPVEAPARLPGGATIDGIRLWHTVSRLSALVHFRDAQDHGITLFVISAENLADRGGRTVERGGRTYHVGESFQNHVVAWQQGGAAYALVADLPIDALLEMARGFPSQG